MVLVFALGVEVLFVLVIQLEQQGCLVGEVGTGDQIRCGTAMHFEGVAEDEGFVGGEDVYPAVGCKSVGFGKNGVVATVGK